MPSALRRAPGSPPELGIYRISGSLDGVRPGRRTVKTLEVSNLDGQKTVEGLLPLRGFPDLERLTLENVRDVDLEVLAELDVPWLRLEDADGVDLSALSHMSGLQELDLVGLGDGCGVPGSLVLADTLWDLFVSGIEPDRTGGVVQEVLRAIDWSRLRGLRRLDIRVRDLDPVEPITADLGFLRHLQELESLRLWGIRHVGAEPSPLEPPFDGLPRTLKRLIVEVPDPEPVREGLQRVRDLETLHVKHLPVDVVRPMPWQIAERRSGSWRTYGSLADAFGLSREATEQDGLRQARARLRAADAALLRRLGFDSESAGTAIEAGSREDLEAALRILGLAEAESGDGDA